MKKMFTILLFSLIALTASKSQTVDGIINKYFESIGGIEKLKTLKTEKMIGMVPTPQGDFAFTMSRKSPNKFMISLDVMGKKLIPQAYDGEIAWMLNPFTGDTTAQKLPEDQAKSLILMADIENPFIDYAKKGYEATYEGEADLEGIKCLIVKLVKDKGESNESVASYYIDSESYLPLMVKQKSNEGQAAGQEVEVFFSDYQDAGDGFIMPYSIDTKMGGQSVQAIKFTTIEVNKEIPDDIFRYPGK
jgi:outer membrane lipoprotein-sorting protein